MLWRLESQHLPSVLLQRSVSWQAAGDCCSDWIHGSLSCQSGSAVCYRLLLSLCRLVRRRSSQQFLMGCCSNWSLSTGFAQQRLEFQHVFSGLLQRSVSWQRGCRGLQRLDARPCLSLVQQLDYRQFGDTAGCLGRQHFLSGLVQRRVSAISGRTVAAIEPLQLLCGLLQRLEIRHVLSGLLELLVSRLVATDCCSDWTLGNLLTWCSNWTVGSFL